MFAKIFTQIFDSSIVENPEVRFTFMDLLVLADINGVVDMTHEAIARRTNRPIELIRETILALEGPDPRSRTPDADGRRIARLDDHRDWGWMILNYDRFREIASEEQKRAKTLARVHRHRSKTRQNEACNAGVTQCNAPVTNANAGNAMQRQRQRQKEPEHERESHFAECNGNPTLKEVLAKADMIGLLPWKAEDWFNEMQGCGWLDFHHRPIKDWTAVLTRVKVKWESDGRPESPPKATVSPRGDRRQSPLDLRTIIQAKEATASDLRNRYCSETSIDSVWSDQAKKQEFFNIKREIRKLTSQLSNMA